MGASLVGGTIGTDGKDFVEEEEVTGLVAEADTGAVTAISGDGLVGLFALVVDRVDFSTGSDIFCDFISNL
jgi:hypothetical protein